MDRRNRGGFSARKLVAAIVAAFCFFSGIRSLGAEAAEQKASLDHAMLRELAETAKGEVYRIFTPELALVREDGGETPWLVGEQMDSVMPLYGYLRRESGETDQGTGTAPDPDPSAGLPGEEIPPEAGQGEETAREETLASGESRESVEELMRAENEAAYRMQEEVENQTAGIFLPHERQASVDLDALRQYETLLREFYTVDANTMAGSDQLDVTRLTSRDLTIEKEGDGPQILIYHTHSQEGFVDSVPGDDQTNIQGVGERLARILQDTYGYSVLHHTGEYDLEGRDDAYSNALPQIEKILAENPSIQVVIDLHRDQMPEETRLVTDLDGRPTARFMFFNGLSRTKTTGNIAYLANENLEDNLAFSFQMQLKAAEYYPGLTRKIYLKGYRYNMHLKPRSLLIELGAQNNTLEEALNACDPLAHILDLVLSGEG